MKIIRKIYFWATKTRLRKILSATLAVLIFLTSIKYIFYPAPKVKAGDVYLGMNEGYGTSSAVNDNNGSVAAGSITNAVWKTEDLCKIGKCLYFDGTGDYVSFADDADLDMGAGETVTVEGWFRTPDITSGTRTIIAKEESTGTDGGYRIEMDSSGFLRFGIDNENTLFPSDSITTSTALDDNKWHHFAAVKNGSSSISLYVDAALIGTDSSIQNDVSNDDTFYIGIYNGSTNGFSGFIDEVKVYRSARTQAEIKADYLGTTPSRGVTASFGPPVDYLSQGLVAYWKMNENTGTSTSDSSGNSNNSTTWTGSTWATGKFGSGTSYDGVNQVVRFAETTSTDLGAPSQSFTVSSWFKTSTNFTAQAAIIAKYTTSTLPFELYLNSSEQGCFSIGNSDGQTDACGTTALNDGAWHQMVGVKDADAKKIYLYIDGSYITTTSYTSSNTYQNNDDISIGNAGSSYNSMDWTGQIDETRIYNRPLPASEVSGLYAFAPGPVGYWRLDENSGSTAYDSSGNGVSGTLYNGSKYVSGKFGSAGLLDGTNDLIDLGSDPSTLMMGSTKSMTASVWLYRTANSGDGEFLSVKTGPTSTQIGWEFYNFSTGANGGNICAYISDGTNQSEACSADETAATLRTWEYWTFTFDRSTRVIKIYKNGIDVTHAPYSSTPATMGSINTTNICARIGSRAINESPCAGTFDINSFAGYLDEIKVYDYVRTNSQIVEDMNGGHPQPGSPVGSATSYWKFDEGYGTTAYDDSINANNLTLSAAAAWTNSGKFGKAFDGADNRRLTGTDDADFEPAASEGFSISTWVKSDGATTAASEYVVSKTAAGSAGYDIYFNTSGQIVCEMDDDTTGYPEDSATTSADYYDQSWHHVVCVRDVAADKVNLYVDGRLVAQDTDLSATGAITNTAVFYLGDTNATDGTDEFLGNIDETKFYRLALTPDQVKVEYNRGQTSLGSTSTDASGNPTYSALEEYCPPGQGSACTAPYAEYKFDENTGTTAQDTSGNGNSGTLYNTARFLNGKVGTALYLDGDATGNDSHVQLPNGAFNSLTEGTISFWYNADLTGDTWQDFLTVRDNAAGQYLEVAYQTTDNTIHWWGNGCDVSLDASITVSNPTGWHHVAVTVNSSGYKIYLDGILKTSGSNTCFFDDLVGADAENYAIGCYDAGVAPACTGELYRGYIDNFRIYNYARTATQIVWEYNRGKPYAWWKMDETSWNGTANEVKDSSGNGFNGTGSGGVTTTSSGKFNYAGTFDGTNDNVSVAYNANYDFTDNLSISFWFKPTSTISSGFSGTKGLMSKANTNTDANNDWQFSWLDSHNGRMRFGTYGDSIQTNTSTWTGGVWYHITVVVSNTNTANIYVNGILDTYNNDSDISSSPINGNQDTALNIGLTKTAPGDFYFDGQIDDVRIYNYPLAVSQIKTIINEDSTLRFGP